MVAMNVWPTDAADGSVANEARWRKMGRIWAPSAVVAGVGSDLAPTLAMPNLTVQAGAAWVDGHYTELPNSQVITATANGLAVVRFDPAANTAELLWRDAVSVPTQNPTGTWELPIAKTVGSVLTDLRVLYAPRTYSTEIDLTSAQSFVGIPQNFSHLRLIIRARTSNAVAIDNLGLRFNDDAAANYRSTIVRANNNLVIGSTGTNQTAATAGMAIGTLGAAGTFSTAELTIVDYVRPGITRAFTGHGHAGPTAALPDINTDVYGSTWLGTAPITKITITIPAGGTFVAGSRAWLSGVA